MKICIDAGHGLNTAGKRCDVRLDFNSTREWVLNSRIANLLEERLKNYECSVIRSDDITGVSDIALLNRVKTANDNKADVFLSIHHNAGAKLTESGGVVVYYSSSKSERETQSQLLYNEVTNANGLIGNRSNTVNKYPYYVLKNTTMPAFLIENGFMDSKTDVPIILTKEFAIKTADGIISFFEKAFNLKKKTLTAPEEVKPTEPQTATKIDYEKIGKLFVKCMNDMDNNASVNELMSLMGD